MSIRPCELLQETRDRHRVRLRNTGGSRGTFQYFLGRLSASSFECNFSNGYRLCHYTGHPGCCHRCQPASPSSSVRKRDPSLQGQVCATGGEREYPLEYGYSGTASPCSIEASATIAAARSSRIFCKPFSVRLICTPVGSLIHSPSGCNPRVKTNEVASLSSLRPSQTIARGGKRIRRGPHGSRLAPPRARFRAFSPGHDPYGKRDHELAVFPCTASRIMRAKTTFGL